MYYNYFLKYISSGKYWHIYSLHVAPKTVSLLCRAGQRLHLFYETVPADTDDCDLVFLSKPPLACFFFFLRQLSCFPLSKPLLAFISLFSPIQNTLHLSTLLFKVFYPYFSIQIPLNFPACTAPLSPAAAQPLNSSNWPNWQLQTPWWAQSFVSTLDQLLGHVLELEVLKVLERIQQYLLFKHLEKMKEVSMYSASVGPSNSQSLGIN